MRWIRFSTPAAMLRPFWPWALSTVRPMLGLARLALAAQDRPRAAQWVDRALQWAPADPEALLAALVIARWRHGEPGVQYWVKQHRLRHGDLPELHRALGDEALVRGRLNEAVRAWRRSQRRVNDSHVALQLAQASVARGEIDEARRAIAVPA